jgi:orotidine-5'-phosphate decarboxylase
MIKWQRNSGIMLALDAEDSRTAFELLDRVAGDIDLIKLNYYFLCALVTLP